MANIRQLINNKASQEVSDDLLLVQNGITSVNGNLTALGRRVMADLEFRSEGAKASIAQAVRDALSVDETADSAE